MPWDTETLCENGGLWEGLKRFHQVVLDTIAEALTVETAQADARREGARRRDASMVATALTGAVPAGRNWPRQTPPCPR